MKKFQKLESLEKFKINSIQGNIISGGCCDETPGGRRNSEMLSFSYGGDCHYYNDNTGNYEGSSYCEPDPIVNPGGGSHSDNFDPANQIAMKSELQFA